MIQQFQTIMEINSVCTNIFCKNVIFFYLNRNIYFVAVNNTMNIDNLNIEFNDSDPNDY